MIEYSTSPIGLYAQVDNQKIGEHYTICTFFTPYKVYETDVFSSADALDPSKDVCAINPIFVEYSSSPNEAQECHKKTAEFFEQLISRDTISKRSIQCSQNIKFFRAQKINIIRQILRLSS